MAIKIGESDKIQEQWGNKVPIREWKRRSIGMEWEREIIFALNVVPHSMAKMFGGKQNLWRRKRKDQNNSPTVFGWAF